MLLLLLAAAAAAVCVLYVMHVQQLCDVDVVLYSFSIGEVPDLIGTNSYTYLTT